MQPTVRNQAFSFSNNKPIYLLIFTGYFLSLQNLASFSVCIMRTRYFTQSTDSHRFLSPKWQQMAYCSARYRSSSAAHVNQPSFGTEIVNRVTTQCHVYVKTVPSTFSSITDHCLVHPEHSVRCLCVYLPVCPQQYLQTR